MHAGRLLSAALLVSLAVAGLDGPITANAIGILCYVDADATGGGNTGASWANAYLSLQSALVNPSCNETWVAEGLYKPGDVSTASFSIDYGKSVYGGFAGTETTRSQRNFVAHVTILSGDIDSNDINTDGNNISENYKQIVGTNSSHVVWMQGTTSTLGRTLDGFTITGGEATSTAGGGMLCDAYGVLTKCSPTLANLVFSGNYAGAGGGGLMLDAENGGESSPNIFHTLFRGNYAGYGGGGLMAYAYDGTASPILTYVTFDNNSAPDGGGLESYAASYTEITYSSPQITNATFHGNDATNVGGAISLRASGALAANLTYIDSATFNQNEAGSGGAVGNDAVYGGVANTTIQRSILWGDTATTTPEVYDTAGLVISYSDIEGGCAATGATCGDGNIDGDPALGPLADNGGRTPTLALRGGSAAIDAYSSNCPIYDQRVIVRRKGAACDMGAYERIPPFTDFDGDAISDPAKFEEAGTAWCLHSGDASWHSHYLGPGTYVGRSDFDGDARADAAKFDASNSLWYIRSSDDVLVGEYMGPGSYTFVAGSDYDRDNKTDPAQFNTTVNALWYRGSLDSVWHGIYLGPGTYSYVTGSDFDRDGKSDPAHFNYSSNVLWYMQSSDSTWYGVYMGPGTYTYVEASDFDGDGMTDPAQFTGSSNTLWYIPSGGGGLTGVWMGGTPLSYVPAVDFDGDGMTDPAGFDSVAHLLWYLPSGGGGWTTIDMGAGTYTIVN